MFIQWRAIIYANGDHTRYSISTQYSFNVSGNHQHLPLFKFQFSIMQWVSRSVWVSLNCIDPHAVLKWANADMKLCYQTKGQHIRVDPHWNLWCHMKPENYLYNNTNNLCSIFSVIDDYINKLFARIWRHIKRLAW